MPVQFRDADQALSFLKEVAAQSYGSGLLEGTKGGAGSIGMIGGRPVKFNTHWRERRAEVTTEMTRSSNELRESLGAAATVLSENGKVRNEGRMKAIRQALGLAGDGSVAANKTLLSRQVAAQVLKMIDEMRNEFGSEADRQSSFDGVKAHAKSSKGVNTRFAAVDERERDKRYLTGDLTSDDVKALNTNPMGTKVPVKAKYPKDLERLQQFFDLDNNDDVRNKKDLDGFRKFFVREYSYTINGQQLPKPTGTKEQVDDATKNMETAMRTLFEGDEDMLNVFDNVFHSGLSIIEQGHYNDMIGKNQEGVGMNGVTLVPSSLDKATSVIQDLKLSKNDDGSYHVDFHRSGKNIHYYMFAEKPLTKSSQGNTKLQMLQLKTGEKPKADENFWEMSLSFDIMRDENNNGRILVKPSGEFSTVTFRLPEESHFTKTSVG